MSASLRGGNLEEMHQLAAKFSTNASKLNEVITDLNSRTVDSNRSWTGPAADRFRSEWSEAKSVFERMRQALEEANTAINRSAQNIEAATR